MSDEPRKRSRFDQTEVPDARRSRFDRRSRSPSNRASETRRSRSPVVRSTESPATAERKDPVAAAAAAAAKINAQIQARKGIQHAEVAPIRSTQSPGASKSPSAGGAAAGLNNDIYTQDGDYIRDIEVNDLRNRYTLTKGSTQKMIKEKTGADVTTRGNYYPDKSMATSANPPLYLHITSTSREGLERAVAEIEELMKQELPNLVDERRFKRREPEQVERDSMGRRKWPEEKIPVDLEPIPGFNLRAQVVGQGGSYVKHIQQETRCRVQIKGRGSGFIEHDTGRESDEQMYLHVAGPDPNEVERAKDLCLDLLGNVRKQYEQFKEMGPRHGGGGGGGGRGDYGDRGYRGNYGDRDRERNSSYGGYSGGGGGAAAAAGGAGYGGAGYGGYGGQMSPAAASHTAAASMSPTAAQPGQEYLQGYAQYYGTPNAAATPNGQGTPGAQVDPYAAYGGYQNYVSMYYQYYAAQGQAVGAPPATDNTAAPPPPTDNAPPPPPPDTSYNAVPPPPGL